MVLGRLLNNNSNYYGKIINKIALIKRDILEDFKKKVLVVSERFLELREQESITFGY